MSQLPIICGLTILLLPISLSENGIATLAMRNGIIVINDSDESETRSPVITTRSLPDWHLNLREDAPGRSPAPYVAKANLTMCQACKCPSKLSVRPFTITCNRQTTLPLWEAYLLDEKVEDVILNFSGNDLERVKQIPYVKNLLYIDFNYNDISFVDPYAIAKLPSLKHLSLSRNALRRIHPNAFMGHNHSYLPLEVLDLSQNKLHNLDEDLFDSLYNLFELNLSNNPIKVFDASTTAALNALHKLGKLDLSQTELKYIRSDLSSPVRSLQTLILSSNAFETVPKVLQYAENLLQLNLNNNPIRNLTRDSFAKLHRLEVLNISAMPSLTKITEGTFANTRHLRGLFCSFNPNLTFISPWVLETENFRAGKELRIVHLRQNSLITLAENTFPWKFLDTVDVEANPFVCDCHLRWLRKLVIKDPELTLRLKCKFPKKVEDQPLMHVSEEIFDVCDSQVTFLNSPYVNIEIHSTSLSTKIIVTSILLCCGVLILSVLIYFIRKRRRDFIWAKKSWVHYSKAESNDADF